MVNYVGAATIMIFVLFKKIMFI